MWVNYLPMCRNHIRSNSLTFGLCCKCQLSLWELWLVYFTIHTQGRTCTRTHKHTRRHKYTGSHYFVRTLIDAMPSPVSYTNPYQNPKQPKRANFPKMSSLGTRNAYFGTHSAARWRKHTRSRVFANFCPSTEDSGPSTCSARPTFSNKLPQPKTSRGLNWRTKKYCMRTCHRLSKSLTSAHYERRHAVTNTAESSPAVFSLLPYKKIKMAAP